MSSEIVKAKYPLDNTLDAGNNQSLLYADNSGSDKRGKLGGERG
jgi:hypothetical protein